MLRGYLRSGASKPLVLVGGNPYRTAYDAEVRTLARDSRILDLGSVWDQELLDQLYANSLSYLHGHSVGGTNPSLLRAMGAGAAVTAYDVVFNREVTADAARYFSSVDDVAAALEADEAKPDEAVQRGTALKRDALQRYSWDDVASKYEALCADLACAGVRRW
jgi:glycosyltransferase involved in cell wall biosynthesis